ncbi:MAG TPA: PatB family C-S lyase, partial [Burkholderiales bacterium]|nr:PatB family C-S lyase [Burkholderiales bacterium]
GESDILPLWVADMDFRAPEAVIEALERRIRHGIFGYTHAPEALLDTVVSMLQSEYGWTVREDAIVWLPGLVTGINLACRTAGGENVITSIPIYPPFLSAPAHSGMTVSKAALVPEKARWVHDFDALEKAVLPGSSLFLLCNPHNPAGRIFGKSELENIGEFCQRHDLLICSDEIHCGILLDREKRHVPIATLSPEIEQRTITLMAPSKTFNIPGLGCSFAVIPNASLRKRFLAVMEGIVPHVNALGYEAALAAYRDSRAWHEALIGYLGKNRDLVEKSVNEMGLEMAHVEATYLAWIDARKMENPVFFFENAGVGLSDGKDFGFPGYVRLNFGCPRSRLEEALERMKSALK